MYRLIFIGAIILTASKICLAQQALDFAYYDKTTYDLYLQENWKELIPLAEDALDKNFDSYYLRMRLGIAYFNIEKYTRAIKQFQKALKFSPNSYDAGYFLYHSLIALGRNQEALAYYDPYQQKPKLISNIYLETGIKLTDKSTLTRNVQYFLGGSTHQISRRISLFHAYQFLNANYAIPIGGGNGTNGRNEYLYNTRQNEYYITTPLLISKGFYFSPSYHYQAVKNEFYKDYNFMAGALLSKYAGIFKFDMAYAYTLINAEKNHQLEGAVTLYPLSNNHLYLQSQITGVMSEDNSHQVFLNRIGGRLGKSSWLEATFTMGDIQNYSEQNGYLLFNSLDTMKNRFGFQYSQVIGKHVLYLHYIQENKEENLTNKSFTHHDLVIGMNFYL